MQMSYVLFTLSSCTLQSTSLNTNTRILPSVLKFNRIFCFSILLVSANGSYAADWTEVRTLDGKFTTLSQHFEKGKWTLVMLWAANCGICRREYPVMSEFHDRHKDIDAKVIGVSLDGYSKLDMITRHIDEMPMSFNNLIGELAVIAFSYQSSTKEPLQGTPTYMMFNPQGQLVGHNPGPIGLEALEKFIQSH